MSPQGADPLERLSGFQAQQAQQGNAAMSEGISSIGQLGGLPERIANMQAHVLQRAGAQLKMQQLQQQMLAYDQELGIRRNLAETRMMEAQARKTIADMKVKEYEDGKPPTLGRMIAGEVIEGEGGKYYRATIDDKGRVKMVETADEKDKALADQRKNRINIEGGRGTEPKVNWIEEFQKRYGDPWAVNLIYETLNKSKQGTEERRRAQREVDLYEKMYRLVEQQIGQAGTQNMAPGQAMTPQQGQVPEQPRTQPAPASKWAEDNAKRLREIEKKRGQGK